VSATRREFLETTAALTATLASPSLQDGPPSGNFTPVPMQGNAAFEDLHLDDVAEAPRGTCVAWGIPFRIERPVVLKDQPVTEQIRRLKAEWLVFLHTSEARPLERDAGGAIARPMRGQGRLGEHAADYTVVFADGTEVKTEIRRRHHIGASRRGWGENCFQAVAHRKPHALRAAQEQPSILVDVPTSWGTSQTRGNTADGGKWVNWLWAWQNPHPEKEIVGLRFAPKSGLVVVSAVSAGRATSHPLRWLTRKKTILKLPPGVTFDYKVDRQGRWPQIQLDMGQVISAEPRKIYPNAEWEESYNNRVPEVSKTEIVIEYTAHPDAHFHLEGGGRVPVSALSGPLEPVAASTQHVRIRVYDKASGKTVAVKLHIHGESGEYLAPVDRHRIPNGAWFEDYAPEFQHKGIHYCTYIPGETLVDLPLGNVYVEVSKGFEIRPVRKTVRVDRSTESIEIALEKVLPWREHGWVTADTHVHFLSPPTAQLEGAAEGVNVVNLLASQWGELMTNVGDFDGKTTFGSKEAGGDGEWLVRVGTENRQHVLGHISLVGYKGNIIAPMCSGGPDEAAIGDPIGTLLFEWAERCKAQGGVVVLPHFPNPRAEHAAGVVEGLVDAVEMTSWGNFYSGIDPYSLADYYRYLNCGQFIAAVGGTDKMSSTTAVGTVRTYARISEGREFTYDAWLDAVRAGHTFVSYGPLLEFKVDGKPPGSRIQMKSGGGTVDVTWETASVTVPVSQVELVVNGDLRESRTARPDKDAGHWSVRVDRGSWLALRVRGHYRDKQEIIAAHSSPVMILVDGAPIFSALDAMTILDQIEGAIAYLDTVGTRAEDAVYKRLRMKLTAAHRKLHNEMHKQGQFHEHTR
jgi:hypothetical protein